MSKQTCDFLAKLDESIKSQEKLSNQSNSKKGINDENKIEQNSKINNGEMIFKVYRQIQEKNEVDEKPIGQNNELNVQFEKKFTSKNNILRPVALNLAIHSLFSKNYVVNNQSCQSDDSSEEKEAQVNVDHVVEEDDEPLNPVICFEYTQTTDSLLMVPIFKFRKNNHDILEFGTIAIEQSKSNQIKFIIYRNKIKQIQYIGQLVKGLSELKPLGQSPQNILLQTVSYNNSESNKDEKVQFSVDKLKIMFENVQGKEQFQLGFNEYLQ